MYNTIYETNRQSRFNARYRMLGAGALGLPRGMPTGWEVGGGYMMGNTCTPVAGSFGCLAQSIPDVK